MNPTLCFFLFVTLIACGRVLAKEEILATITNDQDSSVFKFVADTDDETNAIKTLYKDEYENGQKAERNILASEGLTNNEGMVLEKKGEREIINLKSDNFNLDNGGTVTIDTLYNGVNGERREYEIEITQSNTGWKLFKGPKTISHLHLVINKKLFIGAVGVKDIVMK
jgi:hypothetical protein